MLAVLLTIHMIACVALVIAVMLQRSEGGALGMGGGGTGGVISGRGAASVLVRTTMGLAAVFFTTSIIMTRLNNEQNAAPSTLEQQQQQLPVDPFDPLAGAPATTTPSRSISAPADHQRETVTRARIAPTANSIAKVTTTENARPGDMPAPAA